MSQKIDLGLISAIGCGQWDASTVYKKGQYVMYNESGSSDGVDVYVCLQNTTAGTLPTDTTHWHKETSIGDLNNAAAASASAASASATSASGAKDEAITAKNEAIEAKDNAIEAASTAANEFKEEVEPWFDEQKGVIEDAVGHCETVASATEGLNSSFSQAELQRQTQEGSNNSSSQYYGSGRCKNERDRLSAESSRVSAESGRVSAESTRQSNEETRKSQETSRQNAEGLRTTAFNTAQSERATAFATEQSNRATTFTGSETIRANTFSTNEGSSIDAASASGSRWARFKQNEAERAAAFTSKESQRDEAVAVATALTPRVTSLETDNSRLNALLGLYTDRASLTLSTTATGAQNGKAVVPAVSGSMYGKVEAMAGACVSQEFSLTRGDLLLIKPGKTSNDVFTVAQVVTSSDGSKSYQKVMCLNQAAEVPTDGYLRFLVMPADMTVCITFFASEAAFSSEVKVMRCGSFASICTQVGNIYADMESRLKTKADLSLVNNMIATFEESQFAYGVEWDITNANPDVTRIGNLTLHASLPVQSLMRGCLLNDNGDVVKYLNPTDWTSETRDGSQGQVMVEIPEHYRKFVTDGNKRQVWLSTIPLSGYVKVPRQYVSAYEASLDRAGGKLASVVNMSTNYRGGGNNASWDGTYRSLLGRPVTNVSLTNFRAYARKRGSNRWACNTYLVQKTLYWLFVVEYATRNSQKAYNSALTTAGYRQGGLGMGVSETPDWGGYNGYYPFVPCGHTDALGNQSGVVTYNALKADGSVHYAAPVPRYRGVENPFGHIWKWTDGINVMVQSDADGGESRVYVATDPSKFSDANAPKDGYTHVGNELRSDSYIKDVIFGTEGEIMALTNGAGESTYYCDYHYVNIPSSGTALRGVLFGGCASNGARAGLVFSDSGNAPSGTYAYLGSRLCFVPA